MYLLAGTGTGGYAAGDTYANISNVIGSPYNDKFYGDINANAFDGGSAGNDTVSYLNSGNTTLYGSGRTSTDAITVNLTSGVGTGGDANLDTYSHIRNIEGSTVVNSTLVGDTGANTLTAQGNTTTNVLMGMGASSGADTYDVRLGGHNSITVGVGTNLIMASAKGSNTLVNVNTGLSNIDSIHGNDQFAQGNTTLQVSNVGTSFDLHQFASLVSGISVLDITSGGSTVYSLSGADVAAIGYKATASSIPVLNIKASSTALIAVTSPNNWQLTEQGTGDLLFYSDATLSTQIARLHRV